MKNQLIGRTLVLLALAALAVPSTDAATLYVATTGADSNTGTAASPFKTIQKGIDAGADGDTVQVAAGIYSEYITWNAKSLALQGAGAGQSVIRGSGADVCLRLQNVPAGASFRGFSVQNTRVGQIGGAALVGSSPAISDCTFQGIGINSNASVSLYGLPNPCRPTFLGCSFLNNYAGGLAIGSAAPLVVACTFSNNSVPSAGGAVFINNLIPMAEGSVFLDCKFSWNNAKGSGGALYCNNGATVTLRRCSFSNNGGTGAGAAGGGVFLGGTATVTDSLFAGNTIAGPGVGGGGGMRVTGTATVTNCTFSGNLADGGGGGLQSSGTATVTNCIFWNNRGGELSIGGGDSITYSDVQGGYAGAGNISADPQFVNAAGGNFRLQSTSPCVDAGSTAAPGLTALDLDGGPRVQGSASDMGAFETWLSAYGNWFVDNALGNDATGTGSPNAPFKSVTKAINNAAAGNSIYVKQGNYGTDRPRITKFLHFRNWQDVGRARIGQP